MKMFVFVVLKSCRNQKKKIGHKKQSFASYAKTKKFVILQVSAILLQPKKLPYKLTFEV